MARAGAQEILRTGSEIPGAQQPPSCDLALRAHLPWGPDPLPISKGTNATEPRSAACLVSPELVLLATRDQASELPSRGYSTPPSLELCPLPGLDKGSCGGLALGSFPVFVSGLGLSVSHPRQGLVWSRDVSPAQ